MTSDAVSGLGAGLAAGLAAGAPVLDVLRPSPQTLPLVVASPHSGRRYDRGFLEAARVDGLTLRTSEDAYVDEIFAQAPRLGAPLLCALFPRAFLDVNREPFELDPRMFEEILPGFVNTRSPRVAAGLGTIARVVARGQEIYRDKLCFADAVERVERFYRPYHATLTELIATTVAGFGHVVLIDAHSMPSSAEGGGRRHRRPDVVLGDGFATTCAAGVIATAERALRDLGYTVHRNRPYAGGFTTRHYGQPRARVHALQIEINRDLYMDEATLERRPFLGALAGHMASVLAALAALGPTELG